MRRLWHLLQAGMAFCFLASVATAEFRAGAAVIDVTPQVLPVIVNGGVLSRSLSKVNTPLNARALVLDDGQERIAIVVVDSCMMPRPLLDDAKELAAAHTEISKDHMLISATHTHSAASCMGALGTPPDPNYPPFLIDKIVEAMMAAEKNLQPAKVGFAKTDAADYTALRRWIRRPDRVVEDPFGNFTVRANMHSGRVWDDVTGESGPEDPDLSLISIQHASGRPLAVLANFSMHYFSDRDISADYFGLFCEGLKQRLTPEVDDKEHPFVGIMSHGCSGDIWRRDYKVPAEERNDAITIEEYTNGLLDIAMQAYEGIEYKSDVPLSMAEQRFQLKYRVPDLQRLEWAQRNTADIGDELPKNQKEVYALEQIILHERQSTEVVVQAVKIGDIGIATTPNETYALTGLKLKKQSPFDKTVVIELANGGDGYIPPPEQHLLGGYNTWAARSAGLEVQAEPKIAETALQLLEQVAGAPRRVHTQSQGEETVATLKAKPLAFWRLDEFAAPEAKDSSGNHRHGIYEPGVVFFLEGPASDKVCIGEVNRCAHFAGGRVRTTLDELGSDYTVSLWFWNGMPTDARDMSGWIFSRGRDLILDDLGDHIGIGGTNGHAGMLVFQQGKKVVAAGKTPVERWTWNQLRFERKGDRVRVYLNGELEIETNSAADFPAGYNQIYFGGRCDNDSNWEGRLDEIAVFAGQ
ncbi:MAG: LamG-like jellyroll fold domain-containing protein [Planctomycetaceae bacterium]